MATLLFCLRDEIIEEAEQLKVQFGWKSPLMGMHIRRGDRKDLYKYKLEVLIKKFPWLSFQNYMEYAKKIKEEFGINQIYLATDETSIISELSAFQPEFEFFYLENTKSSEYSKQDYRWNDKTPYALTKNMLIDLYLLSECNVFVGAQRSMFAWLATRLMYGKGNEIACPKWIGGDVSNKYGYWSGEKVSENTCV